MGQRLIIGAALPHVAGTCRDHRRERAQHVAVTLAPGDTRGRAMTIPIISLALLGIAVVISRVALSNLEAPSRDPHAYWALGLVTPLPAWVVAFLGLLGTQPGGKPQLVSTAAFVLSSAAALVGAITTEAYVRRVGDSVSAQHAGRLWRLGLLVLLPAWAIALIGYATHR
jgi:hypothetical protein